MGKPGDYDTIVKIVTFKDGKHGACTATFVRPQVLLTAAHCVVDEAGTVRPANHIRVETRFLSVDEVYVAPGYLRRGIAWEERMRHDLAWIRVRLPEDDLTDPRHMDHVWPIAAEAPRVGAAVRMVGFGNVVNGVANANGNAREGYNHIDEVDDHFITINSKSGVTKKGDVDHISKSVDATTLHGDSGGPAIVSGQVVGVTSNGGIGWFTAITRFVNLNGPIGREFLKSLPSE